MEDLSHELLHNIFVHVQPADLASLCQTCSTFNSFIVDNRILCKEMYHLNWDAPSGPEEPCWQTEVRKLVELEKILESDSIETKRRGFDSVLKRLVALMTTKTSNLNTDFVAAPFSTADSNIDVFLAASSLFKHAGSSAQTPAATEELRQLSAQLHCLYGVPIDSPNSSSYLRDDMDEGRSSYRILLPSCPPHCVESDGPMSCSQTFDIPTNTYARSKVYDLRQYTDGSFWGPFKNDYSQDVDWEKMEAIMVVLGYNLRMFRERARFEIQPVWDTPWRGIQPGSLAGLSPINMVKELGAPEALEDRDPFGITGMWMRVVCFLDYHDLYAFNFARPAPSEDQPREPIDTREAIRMIKLKLRVTSVDPPGDEDGKDYPVVTFKGTSWSLHQSWDPNANSMIRGCVRQTPQGEIRWTTWSIFHGEERWRSEGIQVGGVRSARGVLGNWFDKDFDPHGPAGPTAFWKISDEVDEDDKPATPPDFLFDIPESDSSGDDSD